MGHNKFLLSVLRDIDSRVTDLVNQKLELNKMCKWLIYIEVQKTLVYPNSYQG